MRARSGNDGRGSVVEVEVGRLGGQRRKVSLCDEVVIAMIRESSGSDRSLLDSSGTMILENNDTITFNNQ